MSEKSLLDGMYAGIEDGEREGVAFDETFATEYPVVHAFLTEIELGGKPRQTGTLLLFTEGGVWKGCVHDRCTSRRAFVTGSGFRDLLHKIDDGLSGAGLEFSRTAKANGYARKRGRE